MLPASNIFGDGWTRGHEKLSRASALTTCPYFYWFPHIADHGRLRFACVTDVRDSSTGLPARRPGADVSAPQAPQAPQAPAAPPARQPGTNYPVRQPAARLVQPGGRHRRPVPASLPEGAPALVLAVPNSAGDALGGATAEITTVLRVDNPALDVRPARIDHGG